MGDQLFTRLKLLISWFLFCWHAQHSRIYLKRISWKGWLLEWTVLAMISNRWRQSADFQIKFSFGVFTGKKLSCRQSPNCIVTKTPLKLHSPVQKLEYGRGFRSSGDHVTFTVTEPWRKKKWDHRGSNPWWQSLVLELKPRSYNDIAYRRLCLGFILQ